MVKLTLLFVLGSWLQMVRSQPPAIETFIGCDGFSLAATALVHTMLICFETRLATILVMGNDFAVPFGLLLLSF